MTNGTCTQPSPFLQSGASLPVRLSPNGFACHEHFRRAPARATSTTDGAFRRDSRRKLPACARYSAYRPARRPVKRTWCSGTPSVLGLMPSRQERRKAERDAAKRAPGQTGAAGAAGATGAAAALANLNVNPLGDWTTQTADPNVGPGSHALLATSPDVVHLKTRFHQSAVTDVSSDVCLARPVGAVCQAWSRDCEAEGCCG